MQTTEAPPTPPSSPAPPPQRRRRRRPAYEEMEGYDLVHIIDELEDERARVALREKIWIALILHILVFGYILLAPKYIWHVKVRDASLALRDKEKPVTVLDLPPDALKQLKPEKPAPLADKNRQQQSPKPTVDPKTLAELERMRRAGPPLPQAPKAQARPAPTPQQPQTAQAPQAPKPQPAPPPMPPAQTAQLDAPKAQPSKPSFATTSPRDAVQEAARAARASGADGGDGGANAPVQHGGNKGAVDVLSDTLGVDFGPYIQRVIYDTKRAWYPVIPEVARPPIQKQGRVLIRFKILPDGSVKEMKLEGPSGDVSLDRAARGGITGASPFPPLPKNFKGPFLELRFYFLYNDNQDLR